MAVTHLWLLNSSVKQKNKRRVNSSILNGRGFYIRSQKCKGFHEIKKVEY